MTVSTCLWLPMVSVTAHSICPSPAAALNHSPSYSVVSYHVLYTVTSQYLAANVFYLCVYVCCGLSNFIKIFIAVCVCLCMLGYGLMLVMSCAGMAWLTHSSHIAGAGVQWLATHWHMCITCSV